MGEGLASEMGQGLVSLPVAAGRSGCEMVAIDDAAQIFIRDWNRMAESVKQNGIGGLGAHAGKREQAKTQAGCG